jgi:hypothetical protein
MTNRPTTPYFGCHVDDTRRKEVMRMADRAPDQRENHPGQVVHRTDRDGDGEHDRTDVWEKNSAGATTKEGHTYVVDGQRYDHWGNHLGPAA